MRKYPHGLLLKEAIHHQDMCLLNKYSGKSVKDIAKGHGVSPSRIYQVMAQGKKRYAKYGDKSGLTQYMRVLALNETRKPGK